jgi:predicted outer membrane repeat protein
MPGWFPPALPLPCLLPWRAQTVEFRAAVTFEGGAGGAPAGYAPGSAVTTRDATGQASLTFGSSATFRGNTGAPSGGGLYLTGASAVFSGPTVFDSNTAQANGGGVWCGATATLTFNGPTTKYVNNAAAGDGGGLYITTGCNVSFGSGTTAAFTTNKAAA